MRLSLLLTFLVFFALPPDLHAQELHNDIQGVWHARVIETQTLPEQEILGTQVVVPVQYVTAEILEGERQGERVTFLNDYIQLEAGDLFFMNYLVEIDGREFYSVREPDRLNFLLLLGILFAGAIALLGGIPGLRSLVALAVAFALIIFGLLPLLLAGYPPLPISIAFAIGIVGLTMAITHGFSRPAVAAFIGSMTAVLAAGILAEFAVGAARLSGFASDEAVYLNLSTLGTLDISGLLLSAILIGALGVLDDIAITQAAAVEEINAARGGKISPRELYRRANRIGREHIGAVVNTLALAYVGASLPLLLLFSLSDVPVLTLINQEIFATEIVRTVVGSIALAIAVPATTLVSVWFLKRFPAWRPKRHLH